MIDFFFCLFVFVLVSFLETLKIVHYYVPPIGNRQQRKPGRQSAQISIIHHFNFFVAGEAETHESNKFIKSWRYFKDQPDVWWEKGGGGAAQVDTHRSPVQRVSECKLPGLVDERCGSTTRAEELSVF